CGRCGSGSFAMISPAEIDSTYPCPRCATPLPHNSRFCGRCGLSITPAADQHMSSPPSFNQQTSARPPQPAERVCQRCRTAYPQNIKFCGRCGLTLQ
ncbi:MAG: zinc ribbon domain-containing protein, partial [Vicinamibacterales bacterium]